MAAPAYVLGDNWTLKDVWSRSEALCNQIEENKVLATSLLEAIKHQMLSVIAFGDGSFGWHYITDVSLTISATATLNVGNANVQGMRRIIAVTAGDLTNLDPGDNGVYNKADDYNFFVRLRQNKEYQKLGRFYYPKEGKRIIELFHGSDCSRVQLGVSTALLSYMRTPYTGFTMSDVMADTEKMDVKDFLVPYVATGAAIQALKQARVTNTGSLEADMKSIVSGLSDMQMKERQLLDAQGKDAQV